MKKTIQSILTLAASCLAVTLIGISISGCNDPSTTPPPVSQQLTIGLERAEAENRLSLAGAKLEALDALGPAAPDALEDGAFYSLNNGHLVEISYMRTAPTAQYTVSQLSVCRNPDAGKQERVFENVPQLDI